MKDGMGDTTRHFWLSRSVARTMGLSLTEAMRCGAISADDYARMVDRCRGCALVEACEEWLSSRTDIQRQPMPGCCITEELVALRRVL